MSGVESSTDSTSREESISHSGTNSPPITAATSENTARQSGVGARSSSPAKRSASERDEDENGSQDSYRIDSSTNSNPVRSPRKTSLSHVSPMPNRFKNSTNSSMHKMDKDGSRNAAPVQSASETSSTTQGDHTMNSSSTSPTSTETDNGPKPEPSASVPSYDNQMETIKTIVNNHNMTDGSKGYVISNTWVNRVQSRTSQGLHESFDKRAREGDVGPVDNSDIVLDDPTYAGLKDETDNSFVPLRPDLAIDQDFVVVPEEAWTLIVQWYSVANDSNVVIRYARSTTDPDSTISNLLYELYPPLCTIQKLRNDESGLTETAVREKEALAVHLIASRSDKFQDFLRRIKVAVGIGMSTKVQVWKVLETAPTTDGRSAIPTPESSRGASPAPPQSYPTPSQKLVIDLNSFTSLEEGIQREKLNINDETANSNYNGGVQLNTIGFPPYQTLILEEQIRESDSEEFISDKLKKTAAQHGVNLAVPNKSTGKDSARLSTTNARRSPTPSGTMTRGRMNKRGRTRGCTGLVNLGNTCYMNSALQCIRSIEELSLYFLQGKYTEDINTRNVLGHGGIVAKGYANLVSRLFSDITSFSPQDFRRVVGRVNPMFSGYGQQDSQEFLSFLVDGIHEDLDRIPRKPAIENPESEDNMINDEQAIRELGDKFRANHHARNDSVAMDLFNGFYKNTMICPICGKVSIIFDPYSLLTLQLPIEQTFQHPVFVAPLDGPLVQVEVDINRNSTVRALKDWVGKRVGISGSHLVMAEMFNGKYYRIFGDTEVLSEANIQVNDKFLLCELNDSPTNWPSDDQRQKTSIKATLTGPASLLTSIPDMESEIADRMAIPILHRTKNAQRVGLTFEDSVPSFILVTREEAQDPDLLFRKVLQRVATMTTVDFLQEDDDNNKATENSGIGSTDSDMLEADESGGSSTEDPKIKTRSLGSEDDLVDVVMNDNAHETPNSIDGTKIPKINTKKLLDPGFFIRPELRNLFELKIYTSPGEFIPCGWSSLNENDELQPLESRVGQVNASRDSTESFEGNDYNGQTPDTSSDEDELSDAIAPNMVEANPFQTPSSESDEDSLNRTSTIRLRGASRRGAGWTSKRKEKWRKVDDDPDSSYLIRLGEGLVLDWSDFGVEQLFKKGDKTFSNPQTVADPELQAKKARRQARKKHGISLEECFEETTKTEILSEDNAWYCNRCKEHRRASKTLEIWTVPDILVIHLKRFIQSKGYNSYSRLRDKVDHLVDFPVEGLDLTGKVGLSENKDLVYDLFAVDNHYGGLGGGHYTAYAQNFFDKKWYDYNDQIVTEVSPDSVVTKAAYLLFYRRRSDKPLGGPILEEIVTAAWASADSSSLSGEASRPDDSSSNESSNVSLGAGAEVNHQQDAQRLLGSAGGHHGLASIARNALDDEQLPTYDEGIGMDEEADTALPGIEDLSQRSFIGPVIPTWSFDNIDGTNAPPGSSNSNSLPGSDIPEAAEPQENRLMEDFPEDVQIPIMTHLLEEDEDLEVAEIKVSSDNE